MKTWMSNLLVFSLLSVELACQPSGQSKEASCPLPPGDYPVQSASYQGDHGTYELMILNSPACFHQPLRIKNLQLARIEAEQGSEKMKLSYNGEENSVLSMKEDVSIKMVQTVTENGVRREQSGTWSPFLTGLAGGVVGGVAGHMLGRALSKPQHYTPPPMQAGQTDLRGFGGVGDTKAGAVRSYQQKYATGPASSNVHNAQPTTSASPAPEKKSFFRTKSNPAPAVQQPSGATRRYQPAASSRRGFFKRR